MTTVDSAPVATSPIPGTADIRLDRLALGTAPLGNLFSAVDDPIAAATLDAALRQGIRHWDTAPYYGLGLAEERIGNFLHSRRETMAAGTAVPLLSTKVGRLLVDRAGTQEQTDCFVDVPDRGVVYDYTSAGTLASILSSLCRLRVSCIDIALIHDPDPETHGSDYPVVFRQVIEQALPTLYELKRSGEVRAVGVGTNSVGACEALIREADLDVVLLAGRFTLLEQSAANSLLPECQRRGIPVIAGAPFNSGLLAAASEPGSTYEYGVVPARQAGLARAIYEIARAYAVDVGAAALQFPLFHPAVSSVLAGARSVGEVALLSQRIRTEIPQAFWDELQASGILSFRVPDPPADGAIL